MLIAISIPVVVVSTLAFFQDQETSSGNQFTAGSLDLQVDFICTYNHSPCPQSPVFSNQHLIFNFQNLVPGDNGSALVSLQSLGSDSWLCGGVRTTSASAFNSVLLFTLWHDQNCNQAQDPSETIYQLNQPLTTSSWPLFDSTTTTGPLPQNQTSCLGLIWQLPTSVGNQFQTNSLNFDLSFTANQSRNQSQFTCLAPSPSPSPSDVPPPSPSLSDAPPTGASPTPTPSVAPELYFSEYIEGSSNNKAVEIYNPSSGSVDLSGYQVQVFTNGSITPTNINLTGLLAPHHSYVLCHTSFSNPPQSSVCQQLSGSLNFNGNDAVALKKISGSIIDLIGVIGDNPVSEWGTGLLSTADNTLTRLCSVNSGNPAGFASISVLASEWVGAPNNTFTDLGLRSCP